VEDFVEYVPERLDVDDPSIEAFSDVFARFQLPEEEEANVRYTATPCTCVVIVIIGVQGPPFDKRRHYLF
jgi:hypothetical protein